MYWQRWMKTQHEQDYVPELFYSPESATAARVVREGRAQLENPGEDTLELDAKMNQNEVPEGPVGRRGVSIHEIDISGPWEMFSLDFFFNFRELQ